MVIRLLDWERRSYELRMQCITVGAIHGNKMRGWGRTYQQPSTSKDHVLPPVRLLQKDSWKLLFPEEFEAWPYGPVLPDVYELFSDYGGRLIHEKFDNPAILSIGIKTFIDEGIEGLRKKSPWGLVRTSHAPGSPWDQIWKGGIGFKEAIPNKLIIDAAITGLD